MSDKPILLIYDKQCPACDFYCDIVRIRESVGQLHLIDARENSTVMEEITRLGWDIDQLNMLANKKLVKTKPKIICNSEHALQGFIAYKNNINTHRVQPHRRDYRLLKKDEIKTDVDLSGKIYVDHKDAIIPTMSRIFKHRYPDFYE